MAKYSQQVMERVRQRFGLEEGDKSRDAEIEAMSKGELFDNCLIWEGIVGFTEVIQQMVLDIYVVKLEGE